MTDNPTEVPKESGRSEADRSSHGINIESSLSSPNPRFVTTTVMPLGMTRGLARLRAKLSDRELSILTTLFKMRLTTGHQIQRLLVTDGAPGGRPRRARALMKRLTDLKLVVRMDRQVGGVHAGSSGFTYGLSGQGLALLAASDSSWVGRHRRRWETSPAFADHVLAITDLYVSLVELDRLQSVSLLAFESEPGCWRGFSGPAGGALTLKPDAFARVASHEDEHSIFFEVDRGTESGPTLRRKCLVYRDYWQTGIEQHEHGVFPVTIWLATTPRRLTQLQGIIASLPDEAQPLFKAGLLADVAATLIDADQGGRDAWR